MPEQRPFIIQYDAFPNRQFVPAALALLVLYFPIIQVGYYYTDDLGRVLLGYNDLTPAGRPLAALVVWVLNLGSPITDITPAPQYLAILFLAAASVAITRGFGIKSRLTVALVAILFGGNPYFFENMSFRVDSVTMSMGAFFSVLPILWMTTGRAGFFGGVLTVLSLLSALMLYQPSANCYPALVSFLILLRLYHSGPLQAARVTCFYFAPFCFAVVVYWMIATYMFDITRSAYAYPTILGTSYIALHTEIAPPTLLVARMSTNFVDTYRLILSGWHTTLLGGVWAVSLFLAIGTIVWRSLRRRDWGFARRAFALFFMAAAIVALFASVVAVQLPLMRPPLWARTFVGWGGLLAAAAIVIHISPFRLVQKFGGVLIVIQAFATYSVAYSYANALADQKRHDERVANDIAKDIRHLSKGGKLEYIVVSGWLGPGPAAKNMMEKYHFARGVVYSQLREDNFWAAIRLRWVGVDLDYRTMPVNERKSVICGGIAERDDGLYSLYRAGTTVLLRFKNDKIVC
jgi:hypothetical protein